MPIITVQRRMAEQGRIRLGQKVTGTNKQGKEYTRPAKLDRFRFTSPSQRLIDEIAAKYGGTARPWDNDGKSEHEVLSDATSIPVIVVKGGFSQWHEAWTKAGCQHRCDGEKDVTGQPCDPDDPLHLEAIEKPTTRLSVMLSEIETLGVWRMESKGWNAAAELPSMAELAMHVGDLVPATLSLAERSAVIQTEEGPQTSRFVVPVLDLHVTKRRLVEIVGGPGGMQQLAAPEHAAIEAPKGDAADQQPAASLARETLQIPTPEQIQAADVHTLRKMVDYLAQHGQENHPAAAAARKRIDWLEDHEDDQPVPDEDGAVDAEVVEDADAVWEQIVREGGKQGMTLSQLTDGFAEFSGGLIAADATAGELQAYLEHLRGAEVPA